MSATLWGVLVGMQLTVALGLNDVRGRTWQILPCSARTGEGLQEAMEWLVEQVNSAEVSSSQAGVALSCSLGGFCFNVCVIMTGGDSYAIPLCTALMFYFFGYPSSYIYIFFIFTFSDCFRLNAHKRLVAVLLIHAAGYA